MTGKIGYRETPFERIVEVGWGKTEVVDVVNVMAAFNNWNVRPGETGWQVCTMELVSQTPHIHQVDNGHAGVGRTGSVRVDVDFVYFFELGPAAQLTVLAVTPDGVQHRSPPTTFSGLAGFGTNHLAPVAIGAGVALVSIEAKILAFSEDVELVIQPSSIAKITWSPGSA